MTQMLKTVLVTGGAGFIGSHLAQSLVSKGCKVTVLDNLSTGRLENLSEIRDQINFVEGDITDESILLSAVQDCEAVFHQAAIVSVTQTVKQPVQSAAVNDLGTLTVLEAARRNNVGRVILASSSAVYGDDPQLPKTETMIPNPLSPYAVQKLTNEHYAALYHQLYGIDTVCLRYFNVFGPRQDPSSPYSGVISIFMRRATERHQPIVYGDGGQTRDFVFVGDVVQANILAATSKCAPGQVYNVGTDRTISINKLWERIARLVGIDLIPQFNAARAGDIVHSRASIKKAQEQLAFEPEVTFDEGLELTLAWYQQGK